MKVKTVELPGGVIINVIVDETFTFLLPISELTNHVGLVKTRGRTSNLTAITRGKGFVENIHYKVHQKGDIACYKNLKPGSRFLTRLGMVSFCTLLKTPEAKKLGEWASNQTCKKLTEDGEIYIILRSMIRTVSKIKDTVLKRSLLDDIKELRLYI